jgi:DNA-binding response OmpR family regulator
MPAPAPKLTAPIPVAPMHEHKPVFETLAGAPLPVKPPLTAAAPAAAAPMEGLDTVLVIDDSEVALRLIESVLRTRRHRVITARSGKEGLARMRETMPDLIILDGMLPEVHGFDICRQIKTSDRFKHIPVIMLSAVHTGWRFAQDVKQKYGADDYLTKPFNNDDLLRRVDALLKRTDAASSSPSADAAVRLHLKDGFVALKNDRLDEALAAFEHGLKLDPWNDMLHYYMAITLEKKGRVFDAIDHYEKAVQLNPQSFDAITALANLYQRQEFWRKARELWELALDATKDQGVRTRIKEHLLSLL